ncbi:Nif3-like dinuclear metal center hexameric protein [Cardiobacteriales bacterium ML27]|uniref:Nif3-like dinuclear metal center hexameric protein n=2 Tax=Ostreibacterium oceani TaxID=2654998 RepID=A0A6N7EVA1_9GAMM|nr:Nif3-like dinuclear metal center hexameric protein [Ostreibacterium oceani]MPV86694.1 Nif3-like dinuclear metal center hexameric protein [Ostreibacterium oceani]
MLSEYLADLLLVDRYQDYTPNGLQVAGKKNIQRIVFGVTASMDLIEAAIAKQADAIIVHHGYFWKNESPVVTGMKQRRLKALLQNDINLYAYHLPLDGHEQLGNNAQLAGLWQIDNPAPVRTDSLLWIGDMPNETLGEASDGLSSGSSSDLLGSSLADFADRVASTLARTPQVIAGGEHRIQRIAWCSGAAQSMIEAAKAEGADAFVSGEISEQTVHFARENGIHYIAAGHHATERGGVSALAQHLQAILALDCCFIDCANPV